MFGDITICAADLSWSSNVATPAIQLPQNRRLMVLAMVLSGPSGSTGEQVIVQSIQDSRMTIQRVLGNLAATNGIPFRTLGHCGSFDPLNGPRWPGARSDLVKRLRHEAELAGMDPGYLVDALSQLYRTSELPPIAGFVVNGQTLNLRLLSLASDQPTKVSIIAIELAPSQSLDADLLASPFWFPSSVVALGTPADPGIAWSDQLYNPAYLLTADDPKRNRRRQKFLHRATRLTRFNSSTGALITAESNLITLSGERPQAGGLYFYGGSVPAPSFADNNAPLFCVDFPDGALVNWTATKGITTTAANAYLSHYLTVGE